MKKDVFKKLFIKNSLWFILEMISAYIAARILLLGSSKISGAIDSLFYGNLSDCVNARFWVDVSILVVMGFVFTYLQTISTKYFAANMQTGFRKQAGSQLIQLQFKYFDTHTSARVLNNLIEDVMRVSEYYSEILPSMVTSLITIVTILFSLARLDMFLTLLLMITVPFMVLVSRLTGGMISKLTRKHTQFHDEVNELAYDAINGINVVKSYNLENHFKDKIKQTNRIILKFEYRRNAVSAIAGVMGFFLSNAPQIILGMAALHRVLNGHLTIGEMTYFILLLDRLVNPLGGLPNYFIEAKTDLVSKHRLEELMIFPTEKSVGMEKDNLVCGSGTDYAVSFEDVCFSYDGSQDILSNFNLKIEQGKNVAFVGESGGGKSTIFKLICGLYETNAGKIRVFGRDVSSGDIDDIRHNIALVSQDTYLFPESVAWNVACGDKSISMEKIIDCCKKARIHDEIMKMPKGYNTNVGERGDALSGGQKQRIAIARALLKDARLILFDEPTASVDVENEDQIKRALEEIKETHTIITIAHRLNTIEEADCIYVLQHGKIVEYGKHTKLLQQNAVYGRLYKLSQNEKSSMEVSDEKL